MINSFVPDEDFLADAPKPLAAYRKADEQGTLPPLAKRLEQRLLPLFSAKV